MMVSFEDLRSADPRVLADVAQEWAGLGRRFGRLHDAAVTGVVGALYRSGWQGPAADAARGRVDDLDDRFEVAARQSRDLAVVLGTAARRMSSLQLRLETTTADATAAGMWVGANGRVEPAPLSAEDQEPENAAAAVRRSEVAAQAVADALTALLEEATELDARVSETLSGRGPGTVGDVDLDEWGDTVREAGSTAELMGLSAGDVPAAGDPRAAAAWWAGLSSHERSTYAAAYPARIGALPGLPAQVRHEANMLALQRDLNEMRRRGGPRTDQADLDRGQRLLDQLEASEHGPASRRLMLLDLDLDHAGDGRAVVAVGDPDTARHTAVFVPGVGTSLSDVPANVQRALWLQEAADSATPGAAGDVAVVLWLGYDAPENPLSEDRNLSAATGARARSGAEFLDSFVDALRVSHVPGPSHVTVVGHSYGSAVVGEAASAGDGLAVQDIVTAGSPGMRVEDAGDLQLDPRHVWAGAAADDPIVFFTGSPPEVAVQFLPLLPVIDVPFVHAAHGQEPTAPAFGANRYTVDTPGHSDYWRPESRSVLNQAAVVVGQYDQVELEHGAPPEPAKHVRHVGRAAVPGGSAGDTTVEG